ncbi:hypothetical protein [Pantoea sp. 18069]|uniref:hypothetical protein n=1 Tax=Pantoea sp. 18069 TaxID=2681415 RepID=UPI0013596B56|nr:hypothetical protein [Pantoea sp. 18069]
MIHKHPLTTAGLALPAQGHKPSMESRTTLARQLGAGLQYLEQRITLLPEPYSCCVLFFTVAAKGSDACVFFVRRSTLEAAWREGTTRVRQWAWVRQLSAVELRIDWPNEIVVIGSRIPALCQWGSASAWALADDDLEHAELISPMALFNTRQSPLDTRLKQFIATPAFPAMADVNLLLRLQGLRIGEDGVQTELPKVTTPPPPPVPATRMPPVRTEPPSCEHRQCQGNGLESVDCDRLCVTYALLLAQHHVAETELAQTGMMQAIERAFACLEKNIDSLGMRADAAYIEQAMCLLIFTRYIVNRNTDGAFTNFIGHLERLAQDLIAIKNAGPPDTSP